MSDRLRSVLLLGLLVVSLALLWLANTVVSKVTIG